MRLAEDRATQEVVECRELVTEAVGDAEKAKEAELRQHLARTEVRNISVDIAHHTSFGYCYTTSSQCNMTTHGCGGQRNLGPVRAMNYGADRRNFAISGFLCRRQSLLCSTRQLHA